MTSTARRVMDLNRRRTLLEGIVVAAVIVAAFYPGLSGLQFHVDESHWIGLSAPFEAFVAGRFSDPIWEQRQDKVTNATVTYYVIGAARRIGGFPPERLNRPWRWFAPYGDNVAEGRMPEPRLLWWSRAGVTTAAALALFLLFVLLRDAAGRPAGYLWLALALVNPYLRDTLRHAMNEGVLLCFVALATWATARALPHLDRSPAAPAAMRRAAAWLAVAAVAAGLAAQTKLNGGLVAVGMIGVVGLAAMRAPGGGRARLGRAGLAALLVGVLSFAAFVAANPTMWPDPLRESVRIVRARAEVTKAQSMMPDARRLSGVPDRAGIVLRRVFVDYALVPLRVAGPVLFATGTAAALAGFLAWMRRRNQNHALASLVAIGTVLSLPMLFTPLDWPRYFMLPVVYFGMATVAGVVWLTGRVRQRARGRAA